MSNFPSDPSFATQSQSMPPGAPPTSDQFGYQPEPEPASWPRVIGIISIVWGSLGLLCGVCGLLQIVAGSAFQPQPAPGMPNFQPPPPSAMMMASSVLGMLPPILLVVAGVLTLQRKSAGRTLHLIYAVLSILFTIFGTVVAIAAMDDTMKEMERQAAEQSNPQAAQQMQQMMPMIRTVSFAGIGVGVLLGLAYPIFILVWFGLVKKGTEELTRGTETDTI